MKYSRVYPDSSGLYPDEKAPVEKLTASAVLRAEAAAIERRSRVDTPARPRPDEPGPHNDVHLNVAEHRGFLLASTIDKLQEYKRQYLAYDGQMRASDEAAANAEIDRRVTAARQNPSPENLEILAQESCDELRKKYKERWTLFEGLRAACISKFAPQISAEILPRVTAVIGAFRVQCDREFRDFNARWRIPYNPSDNQALRAIDSRLFHLQHLLTIAEHARENRYPSAWETTLPHPDALIDAVSGNLTPIADEAVDAGALKTSADIAAQRAA